MNNKDLLYKLREQMQAIEDKSSASKDLSGISDTKSSLLSVSSQEKVAQLDRGEEDNTDEEGEFSTHAALTKIVNILSFSDKSELALRRRLRKEGFKEEVIEEAIAKATSYGFVNDARFADVLIRSRINQGKGSVGIERELKKNGIDPETIEGWPYDYEVSYDSEFDRALDLLNRKPPHSKNLKSSAYRKLITKGFSSSVASSAVREWLESQNR